MWQCVLGTRCNVTVRRCSLWFFGHVNYLECEVGRSFSMCCVASSMLFLVSYSLSACPRRFGRWLFAPTGVAS